MVGGETFLWGDTSLSPLGCMAAKAVPLLLPFCNPNVSFTDPPFGLPAGGEAPHPVSGGLEEERACREGLVR